INFIISLLGFISFYNKAYNAILIIINKYSKYALYIPIIIQLISSNLANIML
ncbi:hypothetical protein M406DRAFT_262310, partial [Cryphonectria parasitica EP155]